MAAVAMAALAVGGGVVTAAAASPVHVAQPPAVTGIYPIFDTPKSTTDGFTVNVTNYTDVYAWYAKADTGQVKTGTASGDTLPITVTGLKPGQSATVEVRAEMPGLESGLASVTGAALKAAAGAAVKGSVVERVTFPSFTIRLSSNGTLTLQRLVARIPTDATPTRVAITVAAPRHASATQIKLARERAAMIGKYLTSRGVTPAASVAIGQSGRPGIATVTVDYVH
jgi:hypothetical protein